VTEGCVSGQQAEAADTKGKVNEIEHVLSAPDCLAA
jgi:hypothetical protein